MATYITIETFAHLARKGEVTGIITISNKTLEDWIHHLQENMLENLINIMELVAIQISGYNKVAIKKLITDPGSSRNEDIVLSQITIGYNTRLTP